MTPENQIAYQVATSIQGKVASIFGDRSSSQSASLAKKDPNVIPLKQQLQDTAQKNPTGIAVTFISLPDILDFAAILSTGNALRGFPGDLLGKVAGFFNGVLSARSPQDLLDGVNRAVRELLAAEPLKDLAMLPEFIKGQLSIAISVVSILGKLPDPAIPRAIEEAYISYLFDEKGFQTVEGDSIAPPTHLSSFTTANLSADLKTLKDAFSDKNAVRYIRDLVRLPVEAACDLAYDLKTRINDRVTANFPDPRTQDAGRAKIIRWMKGFASMAEAGVTGAVEEACSGVGSFQTNQLVAAAAGTFAGTWARKVTQQVFLREI
jgi:hypothetical protein